MHTISGDNSLRDPPVPIPNTEVKPQHADGTWLATARESRSSPDSIFLGAVAPTFFGGNTRNGKAEDGRAVSIRMHEVLLLLFRNMENAVLRLLFKERLQLRPLLFTLLP